MLHASLMNLLQGLGKSKSKRLRLFLNCVVCFVDSALDILHSVWWILHCIFCILYSVWWILHGIFCILFGGFCIAYSVFCILFGGFCIVYSVWRRISPITFPAKSPPAVRLGSVHPWLGAGLELQEYCWSIISPFVKILKKLKDALNFSDHYTYTRRLKIRYFD